MNFPIEFRFSLFSIGPQFTATDSEGHLVFFVKQRAFKLKEHVRVFTDKTKTNLLAQIQADRVIDFSAKYTVSDPEGNEIGSIGRKGMKSLWKAHYEIMGGAQTYTVREKSVMTRFWDGLFGQIPVIGIFAGYLFHPVFEVRDAQGQLHYQIRKLPAFLEGKFCFEKMNPEAKDDELVLLSSLMLLLLEQRRG